MADRSELLATLREAASPLRDVDEKTMFGCEALFTTGAIFALVWKMAPGGPPSVERDVKMLAPWLKEAHAMAAAGMGATKKAKAKAPRRAVQRTER